MNSCCFDEKDTIYTALELSQLDRTRVPEHIAIMPDGNRRWAKAHRKTILQGYRAGADNMVLLTKAAKELGIKTVTYYTFSTENWERPRTEVKAFMWLLESFLIEQRLPMIEQGVRLQSIGEVSRFPASVRDELEQSKKATAHCTGIDMVLAMNYGSRNEICRAVQSIMKDLKEKRLEEDQITESLITRYLDTAQWPDPDLLIRTSGEQRLSNFLLWQTSYSEFHMSKVFWPEFTPQHLLDAVSQFQNRNRRLGL